MAPPISVPRRLSRPAPPAQPSRFFIGRRLVPLALLAAVGITACGAATGTEVTADAIAPAAATQAPSPTVEDPTTWLDVDGFSGAQWATVLTGVVEVVEPSITTTTTDGRWAATGLVRNASAVSVGAVTVMATLAGSDGSTLAVVTTEVAVDPLRPGEPGPFSIDAEVGADEGAQVSWSVSSQPVDGTESRALSLATFWQRGYSDPRPVDHYLYRDEPPARPFVMVGSVTNLGSALVTGAAVTVAWVDAEGRVMAVADGAVVSPDGLVDLDRSPPVLDNETFAAISDLEPTPVAVAPGLDPGASADFIVVVPEGAAPAAIDTADIYLWAMGS